MRGLTRDTFAEMRDQKILWVLLVLTVIAMLLASASRSIDIKMQMNGEDVQAIADASLARAMGAVDLFIAFLLFIVVMTSASAIPHMLERGRADYFLSKPVSRAYLLVAKYLSVWLVYGASVLVGGLLVYSVFAAVDGQFHLGIFALLLSGALQMAVWLSVTFAAGVFSGSTALAIVTAFMLWIFQSILQGREAIKLFFNSDIASTIIDALYYIFPKTSEMAGVGVSVATSQPVETWVSVWTTLLFALVLLILALGYLKRKDF